MLISSSLSDKISHRRKGGDRGRMLKSEMAAVKSSREVDLQGYLCSSDGNIFRRR